MIILIVLNTLKRIFKSPSNYGLLLLFPIVFAVLISLSTGENSNDDAVVSGETFMVFGVVDNDNSVLSNVLITQLETMFNTKHVEEADITATLTDQEVRWILLIPNGYGETVIAGETPKLDGYSLTVSDVSSIGSAAAESITRSLILLGTDNEEIIEKWIKNSELEVKRLESTDNWKTVSFWFGFFGFVSMLTVFFIAKALIDDKRNGMPDRLGILPISPRKLLINSAFAVFLATEITVVLMMAAVLVILGSVPNVLLLFLILSLYNLFTVSMIIAIFSLVKDFGAIATVISISATIFAMIGGSFWPLEFVPPFMQKLAWFSPNYWLTRGIQDLQELSFGEFGISVLFLLGFTIVVILLGGWKNIQKLNDAS